MSFNMKMNRGFTIVELIIVIAILAILESLAVASYHIYIVRAKRSYAEQLLIQDVQFMNRYYAESGVYATGNPLAYPTLPYVQSPEAGEPMYVIGFSGATSVNNFNLVAQPKCNTSQSDDGCICEDKDGLITYSSQTATCTAINGSNCNACLP